MLRSNFEGIALNPKINFGKIDKLYSLVYENLSHYQVFLY